MSAIAKGKRKFCFIDFLENVQEQASFIVDASDRFSFLLLLTYQKQLKMKHPYLIQQHSLVFKFKLNQRWLSPETPTVGWKIRRVESYCSNPQPLYFLTFTFFLLTSVTFDKIVNYQFLIDIVYIFIFC